MPTVFYGTSDQPGFDLVQSEDLIAVRTRSGESIMDRTQSDATSGVSGVNDGKLVIAYPDAKVEVFRVPTDAGGPSVAERKAQLRELPDVRFAGRVLMNPDSNEPVLYTENLFVKFHDTCERQQCLDTLAQFGLQVKYDISYATNTFMVEGSEVVGQKVFNVAAELLQRSEVEYCHPELIYKRAHRAIFDPQWHLKKTTINDVPIDAHANVELAHEITRGKGITIAIIDDGVDIDHLEFGGTDKIRAPRDATSRSGDPRPKDPYGKGQQGEKHGTGCAGVACANGVHGACGVAPEAHLMPIRLAGDLGSQREAEAFKWAVDHGADVISCSWGPDDGVWSKPDDPQHRRQHFLPTSTKLAIDYAVTHGRGGKGCVIFFAAGNGNESVDSDGYASYENVIAVAACNDRGKRSVYSDFGKAVWCAFPSDDNASEALNHPAPLTPGIWTTDRTGCDGYNAGEANLGHVSGDYTHKFGGTSSACPGAAGVAALVLAANPDLTWRDVKDVLARSCDKIDQEHGNYDATGHSHKYGYGRLNARAAVELALNFVPAVGPKLVPNFAPPMPEHRNEVINGGNGVVPTQPDTIQNPALIAREFVEPMPNRIMIKRSAGAPMPAVPIIYYAINVAEKRAVNKVVVEVDISQAGMGNLVLRLQAPAQLGVASFILPQRESECSAENELKKTYDPVSTPDLGLFTAKSCEGIWTLAVQTDSAQDTDIQVSFALGLGV
jgi:subtilisin family serine protease/subtilisin-like proprotein convertase family protein